MNHEKSKDEEEAGHGKADAVDCGKSNVVLTVNSSTVARQQCSQTITTFT